ncbi:hypothetical protein [Sphingobium chungbukense]|uniref:Uncharacterized protein n=1 Tax=Sphingobium chungbukense TaxID=56193 RepID=A0A0M3AS37_9SPHN|nr:hypothetical protein [Sphingobium chungbukense]KKW92670.1 hypothetical protein YP76_06970 [Sphingobium chungbukense]
MTDLNVHRQKKLTSYGEQNWMLCPCQQDQETPAGFIPAVIHDAAGPFIAALVCPECENEIAINGGRLETRP